MKVQKLFQQRSSTESSIEQAQSTVCNSSYHLSLINFQENESEIFERKKATVKHFSYAAQKYVTQKLNDGGIKILTHTTIKK